MTPQGRGKGTKKPRRKSNALSSTAIRRENRSRSHHYESLTITPVRTREDGERIFAIEAPSMGTPMTETEMREIIDVFEGNDDPKMRPTIEAMKRALA